MAEWLIHFIHLFCSSHLFSNILVLLHLLVLYSKTADIKFSCILCFACVLCKHGFLCKKQSFICNQPHILLNEKEEEVTSVFEPQKYLLMLNLIPATRYVQNKSINTNKSVSQCLMTCRPSSGLMD